MGLSTPHHKRNDTFFVKRKKKPKRNVPVGSGLAPLVFKVNVFGVTCRDASTSGNNLASDEGRAPLYKTIAHRRDIITNSRGMQQMECRQPHPPPAKTDDGGLKIPQALTSDH